MSAVSPPCSWPPVLLGLTRLMRLAYHGGDLTQTMRDLVERIQRDPKDAAALLDLSTIHLLCGRRDLGLACQAQALAVEQVYHQPAAIHSPDGLRVLMFATAGDFMDNMPIDLLLEDSDVAVDVLFIGPGLPPPSRIPDHDVAIVGIAESDANRTTLDALTPFLTTWPRPVLNLPERILRLGRETLWQLLGDLPGVCIPPTVRVTRDALATLATEQRSLDALAPGGTFPIIVRPVGSHAGTGLEKLDAPDAIAPYLASQDVDVFYLSNFIDYRNPDGQFRKYRLAFIDGRPYACHVAIADHWMLHYLNAGMTESAEKRANEAEIFARFDDTFALRHEEAMKAMSDRIGLGYYVVDCGETPDGRLLIFEAGTVMLVHAIDAVPPFAYKLPQMRKVFGAFRHMLDAARAPR